MSATANAKQSVLLMPVLLAMWMFLGPSAWASGGASKAEDPFAESHARLMRAADAHLEKMRDAPAPEVVRPVIGKPAEPQGESEAFAVIRPEAVATARERLRALGVEADRIFAEEGVPQALLVVAQVESNFNPLALSPKGARGLWQLMPETAARFGLRVDVRIDERTHPVRATRAAARFLRELYLRFGDWLLALAAYNAGEGRVESALTRAAAGEPATSSRANFWQLATLGLLPEETRRYVPAILARLQG